jgi:hypothetical protein
VKARAKQKQKQKLKLKQNEGSGGALAAKQRGGQRQGERACSSGGGAMAQVRMRYHYRNGDPAASNSGSDADGGSDGEGEGEGGASIATHRDEFGLIELDLLHQQLTPFVLRRCKEDVLPQLPAKVIQVTCQHPTRAVPLACTLLWVTCAAVGCLRDFSAACITIVACTTNAA